MCYVYIFLRLPGTGYVSDSAIRESICALTILMTLYCCQGTTILLLKKQIVCHTMQLLRAHYINIPLGKIHRHVVDVLTSTLTTR